MAETVHYVRFSRGTIEAYQRLKAAHHLDSDTLYFVYNNSDATKGLLYLGEKLISGSIDGDNTIISEFSIGDLGDVVLEGEDGIPLANKQILVYNNGEWVNADLSTIIDTAIGTMVGATAYADGEGGLVPAPEAGDEGKFLRGDGVWTPVPKVTLHSGSLEETSNGKVALKGILEANPGNIASVDSDGNLIWIPQPTALSRTIVDSTDDIDTSSLEAVNKIFMVKKTDGTDTEDDHYEEYLIIDGQLEKVGSFGGTGANLSAYATKTYVRNQITPISNVLFDQTDVSNNVIKKGLVTRVSDIETKLVNYAAIGDLNSILSKNTTIVNEITKINNQINAINDRIIWENLPDDDEE